MRMIAAGQNDHPVWGHRLNSSQALIRHQSFPKRIIEKSMNFCKPQLSKYMYEWITAYFLLNENLQRFEITVLILRGSLWKPHDPCLWFSLEKGRVWEQSVQAKEGSSDKQFSWHRQTYGRSGKWHRWTVCLTAKICQKRWHLHLPHTRESQCCL